MSRKRFFSLLIALFIVLFVILAACQPKDKIVTVVVKETASTAMVVTVEVEKVIEKEVTREVEKIVAKEVEVTVVVTPVPLEPTKTPIAVAILVVDDFTIEITPVNGEIPVPKKPEDIKEYTESCGYTLDGQQGFGSSGAQGFGSSGAGGISSTGVITQVLDENDQPIPHGQLVYNHIRKELNSIVNRQENPIPVLAFPTPIPVDGFTIYDLGESWKITNDHEIYLVPVDTSHYKTSAIINQIEATVEFISRTYHIQYFVLNMSFVIMPCDLGIDSKGDEIPTDKLLEDYLKALQNIPELNDLRVKLEGWAGGDLDDTKRNSMLFGPEFGPARLLYFHTPITITAWLDPGSNYDRIKDDIIRQWLEDPKNSISRRIISVGAAGNSGNRGYEYPFAPAIWDSVVSVSASGWDPFNPAVIASGEDFDANAPGGTYPSTKAYYSNPGEVTFDGQLNYSIHNNKNDFEYYFGTSFATPRLSVLEAIHLLFGGDVICLDNQGQTLSKPPLGYADDNGDWDDLLIETAIPTYCPEFRTTPTP